MTCIQTVTKYVVFGQEFNTHKEAVDAIEGKINDIVRKLVGVKDISLGQSLKITEHLLANRHELANLLNYYSEGNFDDDEDIS